MSQINRRHLLSAILLLVTSAFLMLAQAPQALGEPLQVNRITAGNQEAHCDARKAA